MMRTLRKSMLFRSKHILSLMMAVSLGACASSGPKAPPDANLQAQVSEVREHIRADREKQVDRLSPDNFAKAEETVAEADRMAKEGKSSEDVLKKLGKASGHLRVAESNAEKYHNAFGPILSVREMAIKNQADSLMPKQFAEADKQFASFGKDIENGSFHVNLEEMAKLEKKYGDLELKAVKENYLGPIVSKISASEKKGAEDKAPKTYSEARLKVQAARRAIETNRRDPEAFQGALDEASVSAQKLEDVVSTIDRTRATEVAAVQIYDQKQKLSSTQASLAETEGRLKSEQEESASLAGQAKLAQKIQKLSSSFSPKEAEVFQSGNKITVRLKSVKFPSARAELPQSAIASLSKVEDMISELPVEKVVVEGHTDSVGGEKKNQKLSQERADIVKDYLVSQNEDLKEKVESKGLGYQRPLASNKTKEGRAINRRVDVVIETSALG